MRYRTYIGRSGKCMLNKLMESENRRRKNKKGNEPGTKKIMIKEISKKRGK